MVRDKKDTQSLTRRGLIVGSYCHDVLFRDGMIVAESLGGAASFISAVLDGLSVSYYTVSKVGPDFAYSTNQNPIVIPTSKTTTFHAYFDSDINENGPRDRVLKRVSSCDPIRPSDLPETRFDFGMAVGVGGELLRETLDRMVEICNVVFVDIQAMIRVFDEFEGTVKLVDLKESGFFHILPRIGFLKASAEEAPFMDIEEVRKMCCVVVTNGKDGCTVIWENGELQISPFPTNQVDPTGAGDSFLGGFSAGLVQGLSVPDAALLGNLFGSLTVGQIGLPKFDSRLLQRVADEVQRRKIQCVSSCYERREDQLSFLKPIGHEQFHTCLGAAKVLSTCTILEHQLDIPPSPNLVDQETGQPKLLVNSMFEEPIQAVDSKP